MTDLEDLQKIVDLFHSHPTQKEACEASGISRSTFSAKLRAAAAAGLLGTKPVLPGFHIKKTSRQTGPDGELQKEWVQQSPAPGEKFEMPAGHTLKGVSALIDANGNVIQSWNKTRVGEPGITDIVTTLKDAFKDLRVAAKPKPAPRATAEELLTLIPIADWHLGMFGWHREVGENWDLNIAERTLGQAVDEIMQRSKPSGTAVVLGLGDLFHSDNNENRTARSDNPLQVDGRYQKIIKTGCMLLVQTIDAALRVHDKVIARVLPGNHDEHSSVAAAYFLMAWYRNEPRVTVDVDPSLFWWMRFGKVLLGATHGHTVKLNRMPGIMAHRRAEDWGASKFRYVHGGHLHHKEQTKVEGDGCITEIHQAPIPQDAWHFGAGFLSGRSLQAITYHRDRGEWGRVEVSILEQSA